MLDVHPPHEPVHSWKDFALHIATICIGLLIAIGLEQTVEYFHHRHQAHRLREDLRGEGASNTKTCTNFLVFLRAVDRGEAAMADAVRAAPIVAGKVTIGIPPAVRQRELAVAQASTNLGSAYLPTIPVWETARDTQATALLTPESNRFFANLPYLLHWIDFYSRNTLDADNAYRTLIRTYTGKPPQVIAPAADTLTVTPEQRDRLLEAISRIQQADNQEIAQIYTFGILSHAVADGVETDRELDTWSEKHPQ